MPTAAWFARDGFTHSRGDLAPYVVMARGRCRPGAAQPRRRSTDPVVVALPLETGDLRSKIQHDVDSVCSRGEPAEHIAYFAVESVPTVLKHPCQTYARETYGSA